MVTEFPNLTISHSGTLPEVPFLALKDKILGKRYDLSIAFVPKQKAQALNIAHRGKDYTPNTLSFELSPKSGEIILCSSILRAQHRSFDLSYDDFVTFICIHSMLHLKGMEHGSTMERMEKKFCTLFISSHTHPHEAHNNCRH